MGEMVMVQRADELVIAEQDALLLTRDLLRIAIHTISYTRGLFPKKYFNVKSVPSLEMKINMLMPMDAESRRLIKWMDKGVHDALQKKYLKTLLFCICEKGEGLMVEEYAISVVYPNANSEEVAMNISCAQFRENKSNAAEIISDQISSAREMVQILISRMRTLDPMPTERTILMKLLYNDCCTPEDYEPPFFKSCAASDHIWNKDPLKMDLGDFSSKNFILDLKVKSVLDSSYGSIANCAAESTSIEYESNLDRECYVSEEMVVEKMKRLLKGDVLPRASKDGYTVNQFQHDPKIPCVRKESFVPNVTPTEETKDNNGDLTYAKELYGSLSVNHVRKVKLQGKLDGEHTMQKLIDKMVPEGIVKNSANQISGHAATQPESSNKKLLEITKIVEDNGDEKMSVDTNREHLKFECKDHLRVYKMSDSSVTGSSSAGPDDMLTTQGKQGSRKASMGIRCGAGLILGAGVNPKPTLYAWRLDSGATNHMTGANKWLVNERNVSGPIPELFNAKSRALNIDGMGDIVGPRLRLYNVYLSSDLEENEVYISVSQLTKEGYVVLINSKGEFTIHLANNFNHIVGRGALNHVSMAYLLEFFNGSILERGSVVEEIGEEHNEVEDIWTLDTGSPHHLTGDISMLIDCQDLERPIRIQMAGDNDDVQCWKEGNISDPNIAVNNVCYNKHIDWHLISVAKLNLIGYSFYFAGDRCYIYTEQDFLDGLAYRNQEEGVYYVQFLHPPKG